MTPAQIAELAQLDAQIAADPDDGRARMQRGLLRAQAGADIATLCEDCEVLVARSRGTDAARLINMGRARLRSARRKESANPENWNRAMGAACLLVALRGQQDADKWVSRATITALCQMDDGEAMWDLFEDAMDEDEDETPAMWRTMALVFAVFHNLSIAAGLASKALELEIEDGLWPDWELGVGERVASQKLPIHEQWGWLNLGVEAAPDDLGRLMQRAGWFVSQGRFRDALADFDCAVQMRPDEPKWRERRGAHRLSRPFDEKNPIALTFADYERALRVRLDAGNAGSTDALPARGDALMANAQRDLTNAFRAHACYSLALEKRPYARLYLRRADAMTFQATGHNARSPAEQAEAYRDYARALALDETLDKARAGIAQYLRQTLARPTAHERMEALLDARQELRDMGVKPDLTTTIVAEVEQALAA